MLICAALPAGANELDERREIFRRVQELFDAHRYAELEKMAAEFRTQGSRTSSGLWKISLFYAGLGTALDARKKEAFWSAPTVEVAQWMKDYPDSPTPRLAHAVVQRKLAWAIRGGGWANDVPKANWAQFHRIVEQARDDLLENKAICVSDPNWYEMTLEIATYDDWDIDRFDSLVDEGTARYPGFYPIYFAAIQYLAPKWHGDEAEIERFAKRAVERTRAQEGLGMYARIYWYASQMQYGERLFEQSSVVWPKMKRGIDDVLARWPDQWNINNFAHFACLAGDRTKTTQLTGKVTDPIGEAWADDATLFARCLAWSHDPDEKAAPPTAKRSTNSAAVAPIPIRVAAR